MFAPATSPSQMSNLSKLRVDLRLFAEFVAAGIFTQKEGLPLLGNRVLIQRLDMYQITNIRLHLIWVFNC